MSSKGDVEVANTLPLEDEAPAAATGPPVTGWDRYELLELLGQGGMGVVYKARDRHLGRLVAIKFIHGADPDLTMRLRREAKVLAGLDHPNICRVYEVDHVQGKPYLALQFIDGERLDQAAARMSLEERIAVLRDVAVAVDDVHHHDIVHRDLKPANVMVERSKDGRWIPIVMDFGLAREATDVALTQSGRPLGTPAYMPPEQARGDVQAIDRRSDVYSLGATLYELLTGSVPFPDSTPMAVLMRVLEEEPPSPRKLAPGLPLDLEIIVMKCLAKEPAQRYPSARALANDLGCYLDGEPILGRRPSLWRRTRRRARRHRALVRLGAASLSIIVAVAALGIRASLVSAERARLAEQVGREATEIEGSLREAYLWPPHDTRADRRTVRKRMTDIAAIDHGLGEFGDSIVHGALGRGHLALHEWQAADEELTRAIAAAVAAGREVPELHAARGRALGKLYRDALEQARLQGDSRSTKAWLAQREQALARQYLTPALKELQQGSATGEQAALFQARIALYRRDFAAAERVASTVVAEAPGSSEARRLAADAVHGAAVDVFNRGDYAAAHTSLERALKLYAEASDIARSDASGYEAAAQAWLQLAEIDARQGRSPRESLQRALDVLDGGALRADPEDVSAYTTRFYVLLHWYRTPALGDRGNQPSLLDDMERAAKRATELAPGDARAWTTLGTAHLYRALYGRAYGSLDIPRFDQAIKEIKQALAIRPDELRAHNILGVAYHSRGDALHQMGKNATPDYEAARNSYQDASALEPQYLLACSNQVELYATIAEYEDALGKEPDATVAAAQQVGPHCLRIDHSYHPVFDDMARAQLARASYLADHEQDPSKELEAARQHIAESAKVLRGSVDVWFQGLVADRIDATFRARRRMDPTSFLAAGRKAVGEVVQVNKDWAPAHLEAARLDLAEAAWKATTGGDPAQPLGHASDHIREARGLASRDQLVDVDIVEAEACLQKVIVQPSLAIVDGTINDGIRHANDALQRNALLWRAQRVYDSLMRLGGQ